MPGTTAEYAESPPVSPPQQANRKPSRNRLACQITLLDGTVLTTDQMQVSLYIALWFQADFKHV